MAYTRTHFVADTTVSRETLADFEVWHQLLIKWNRRINLVSHAAIAAFWQRHALDSWQICENFPKEVTSVLDLGSGAGFPGLAVAIAFKHGSLATQNTGVETTPHVTLVEAVGKKTNFLRTVIREIGLPATALSQRIENIPPSPYDVITARAFAPLPLLFTYAQPFWSKKTIGLFLKGESAAEELTEAQNYWTFNVEKITSQSNPAGVLLKITGLEPKAV